MRSQVSGRRAARPGVSGGAAGATRPRATVSPVHHAVGLRADGGLPSTRYAALAAAVSCARSHRDPARMRECDGRSPLIRAVSDHGAHDGPSVSGGRPLISPIVPLPVPVDGAAHEALIDVIADALSVPTRNVTGARASPHATIRDCVLSTSHPVGRFTARFFLGLGFPAVCDSLSRRHRITPPLLDIVFLA